MTLKNNLYYIIPGVFIFFIPLILMGLGMLYGLPFSYLRVPTLITLFLMAIVTIPGFILHWNYYLHDKGKKITFKPSHVTFQENAISTEISLSEVLLVQIHKVKSTLKVPWDNYGYVRFILKDDRNIFFSCLSVDLYQLAVSMKTKEIKVEQINSYFPIIKKS